jgi:hypothetical protein
MGTPRFAVSKLYAFRRSLARVRRGLASEHAPLRGDRDADTGAHCHELVHEAVAAIDDASGLVPADDRMPGEVERLALAPQR